jgi:PAS domain S-box-containing protein
MSTKPIIVPAAAELRRLAEARLSKGRKSRKTRPGETTASLDSQRLLHELQVHQIELEMQNSELREARDRMEVLLEQYTDLYDFAPVGYFTLDSDSKIQLANLTGASLVGIARSRLVGQSFAMLVSAELRPAFQSFLKQVFANPSKQEGDFEVLGKDQLRRIVKIRAQRSPDGRQCSAVAVDITERTRGEEKVRVSEIRYRRLFEAAHDGVLLLDPVTRKITDANPFMTTLLGYPHAQLVGKELFEIGLLKDEDASQEMFQKLKRAHQIRYEDLPLESNDGRHQEVEVVANLYQENGHAVIQCNIRDITQRKRAEQELRLTSTAMEAVANGIFIANREGTIQYINPAFSTMSGYSAEEALGQKTSLVKSAEHPVTFYQSLWQTILSGRVWNGQITNRHKAGHLYVCEQSISPVQNSNGVISHFVSVQHDITERLLIEEAVHRSEALFSALINQAPMGVYVVDARFQLQQLNSSALSHFGKISPLLHRDFAEIIHILWPKKVADPVEARFRHTLLTGEPFQSPEFSERRRDTGVKEVYEWQIQRVTLPAGEYGVVCFCNNITERKKAEETKRKLDVLAATNRKLELEIVHRRTVEISLKQSEQELGRLLKQLRLLSRKILITQEEERKRISRELHDVIAQTLVGINVSLATLAAGGVSDPKTLQTNIRRTQRQVEDSVDIVHRFAAELRPVVLDNLGLTPALEAFMKGFMTDTGVRTTLEVFAGIEQVDESQRTALYRIVQEALTNVARHAKATRAKVSIQRLEGGGILMEITDDGCGFVVKAGAAAKETRRLGLLGMKERIEMIGGTLVLESAPGVGTTVTVAIPSDGTPATVSSRIKRRVRNL